ncbi:aspartate aminotransferase family protein [Spirochaetia bacterium]|nr:aspartate aminotransferase family protein [Spirochaetia bacterium]
MGKPVNSDGQRIQELCKKYSMYTWNVQKDVDPMPVARTDGLYFWDYDGNRYMDLTSQLVNVNIGFNHPKVVKAIQEQAETMPFIAPKYAYKARAELSRLLIEEIAPDNMGKVLFSLAGADANEFALRIAKAYTGREKIFSKYWDYHGSTYGAAMMNGEAIKPSPSPEIGGFVKFFAPFPFHEEIPFPSEQALSAYYLNNLRKHLIFEGPDRVAAIFIEPVTGSNGVIIPPDGYLQGLRSLCDEFGILLVFDEVMMGFGRTGHWFAADYFGVKPDIITFAKGVTCGYAPLGGVLIDKKIADYFETKRLSCGLTYNAHPLGCAAAIATINVYKEEKILENTQRLSKVFAKGLDEIKAKHPQVGDVRCIGLMGGIEFVKNAKTREPLVPYGITSTSPVMDFFVNAMKGKGFSLFGRGSIAVIAPPLIIKEAELLDALRAVDESLTLLENSPS